MKTQIQIAVLLILAGAAFAYGLGMGEFHYYPYEPLKTYYLQFAFNEYDRTGDVYAQTNVSRLISIASEADVNSKRDALINYIWSGRGFPYNRMPDIVEAGITDRRYSSMKNLKSIDRLTVSMDYGINSISYIFRPEKSNGRLLIYHHGHVDGFDRGKGSIQFFLDKGYTVIAFSMPLLGMNNQPVVDTGFGKIKMTKHEYLPFLETGEFSPIRLFVEPVAAALNYELKLNKYGTVSMAGFSGGGWTTVIYSAIDERISGSYPVAGSLPIYLRVNARKGDWGDYEQTTPALYSIASYPELYVLGSYGEGRNQLQIFNKYDPCCFGGTRSRLYEKEVINTLAEIGRGSFMVSVDETARAHTITKSALALIDADIEGTAT